MAESRDIRQAFENAISVLGERAVNLIIEDLGHNGVSLNDPDLSLEKLAHAINIVIGEEGANIIIERLLLQLDELSVVQNHRK
jgi:hypothetical protein